VQGPEARWSKPQLGAHLLALGRQLHFQLRDACMQLLHLGLQGGLLRTKLLQLPIAAAELLCHALQAGILLLHAWAAAARTAAGEQLLGPWALGTTGARHQRTAFHGHAPAAPKWTSGAGAG
jgi:hypothetical protein